jgi:hypothetical protein
LNSRCRGNNKHVNLEPDQLISQRWKLVEPCVRVSILDRYVLVLNIAEIAYPLPKCLHAGRFTGRRTPRQDTYPRDLRRLLRRGVRAKRKEHRA